MLNIYVYNVSQVGSRLMDFIPLNEFKMFFIYFCGKEMRNEGQECRNGR